MSSSLPNLSQTQLLRLQSAIEDISSRFSELPTHTQAQSVILGLNQSITSLINMGQTLGDNLLDPLAQAISQAAERGENTVDQLINRLENAVDDAQSQVDRVIARIEELANGRRVLWVEFDVDASSTLVDYTVDFAQSQSENGGTLYDQGLRLSGESQVDIEVGASGTVRIGLDLNEQTPIEEAVLIDLDGWVISASADATIQDLGASYGVLDIAPSSATLEMGIAVPIILVVGAESYMDLGSFNTKSVETVFNFDTSGGVAQEGRPAIELTIPFDLRLIGFDESTASLQLKVVGDDPFSPDTYEIEWPQLHINGEPFDFNRFQDITVDDFGTFLNEFERLMPKWFEDMEVLGSGYDVGEVVNFAQKVNEFVEQFRDDDGSWNFNGVQEFIERLENALTPDDSSLAVTSELRWSETVDALEWDLIWQDSFEGNVDVDAAAMLGDALPFNVSASGQGSVAVDYTLRTTVGLALTSDSGMVVLDGSTELRELNSGFGLTTRGLLTDHADLSFSLANGDRLDVDLNEIQNLGTTATVNDLIALLNSDTGGELGASRITAAFIENRLVITDNTEGEDDFVVTAPSVTVTVTPDWADPASSELDYDMTSVSVAPLVLGLWGATADVDSDGKQVITSNTLASISPLDRIYFAESEDGQPFLTVDVQADAVVEGGASLGPLSLSVVDGELTSQANWNVDLVDTGEGQLDGRLFLSEWLASDFLDAFEQQFDLTAEGVWQLQLAPNELAAAFGIDNSLYSTTPISSHTDDPSFTKNVPYLYLTASSDGDIDAGASEKLQAILDGEFRALSIDDLPQLVNYFFQFLSSTDFWELELPLVNKTLGDILGSLPDLGRYYDEDLPAWNTSLAEVLRPINWATAGQSALGEEFDGLATRFDDLQSDWANDRPAADTQGWDAGFLARVEDWLLDWDLAIGRLGELRDSEGLLPSEPMQDLLTWAGAFAEFWKDTPPRIENYDWDQLQFDVPDFGQWFDNPGSSNPSTPSDPADPASPSGADRRGLQGWQDDFEERVSGSREQLARENNEFPDMERTFERLATELDRLARAWESGEQESWDWITQFLDRVSTWRGELEAAYNKLQAIADDRPDLEEFKAFVQEMAQAFNDIPMGLQDYGWWIESLLPRIPGLHIDVSGPLLNWGAVLEGVPPNLEFDIEMTLGSDGDPLQYAYDLSNLNLGSVSAAGVDVLNFTTAGDLALMLSGSLSASFGINLDTLETSFDPADLNAEFAMWLDGDDIELGVSLGGLAGVSVGKVSAGDPATITLSSVDDESLPATISYNGASGLAGDAAFAAYLPVYLEPSLGAIPTGGLVTVEANAELVIGEGGVDFTPSLTVDGNFDNLFSNGSMSLAAWIDGAIMFIDGLAHTLESDLVSALPFVPNKDFDGPGTFLGEMRDVLEVARDLNSLEGVADAFSVLFNSSDAWSGSLTFTLDGEVVGADNELFEQSLDLALKDAQTFVVDFSIDALEVDQIAATSLDVGLDGLGIEFSGSTALDIALALGFDLGFGYDFDTGGFEVIAGEDDEVTAEFAVGLQEDSNAKLALGPLNFTVTDGRAGSIIAADGSINVGASELYASFGMDIGDGALGFSSFSNFTEQLDLHGSVLAALDLDLTSNVGLGVELLTGFYDTGVTPVTFSLNPGDDFGDSLDTSKFNFNIENTYISLENLLGDPLLNMLERVESAFEPLMPVIDMINSEVPLISDLSKKIDNGPITYLDAIRWFGEGSENATLFIEFISNTASLAQEILNTIDSGGGEGPPKLYLGGLAGPSGKKPSEVTSPDELSHAAQPGSGGSSGGSSSGGSSGSGSGSETGTDGGSTTDGGSGSSGSGGSAPADAADPGALDRLNQIFASVGLKVPLLTDPGAQLGQLLFGGEVDLITWDIPDLQASFDFRQSFPVFPPLYVSLFGGVGFETNFDLGYDTRGIRMAMGEGGSAADLLNGVYLVDDNHQNYWVKQGTETRYSSGIGDAEMGMTAEIGAGAELNVVVAQAGVEGGLRGNVLADLSDPNPDGKVYLDEFASTLMRGPQCIFDFSGSLNVFLEAFIKVGIDTPFGFVTLFKERFKLAEATILEWGSVSCPPVEPTLGSLSDTVLTLNMGDRAQFVLEDGSIEDGDEVFLVDVIRNEDGSVVIGDGAGLVVSAYNHATNYYGVTRVEFDGGLGNDTVIFTPEVSVEIVGHGGAGDDNLVGGSGDNTLSGGDGNDVLTGRAGNDSLDGGAGDDYLYGYGGSDRLIGGDGDDQLYGDDDLGDLDTFAASNPEFNAGSSAGVNKDTIDGGAGDDLIVAGDDADNVDGGLGDDVILAGDGDDTVEGGAGNDQLFGEAGKDVLYGDDAEGAVTGGDDVTHADKIRGGEGANRIYGGTGNDLLYAVDEDQLESANVSGTLLAGGWASIIEGGDGDDMIYATAQNDLVKGGDGADFMALGDGNNWGYGGKSSDALIDGSGNSTLLGGTGDDVFDGGAGDDYIEGGIGDDQIFGREGKDTIWGGTTDHDSTPGLSTISHYDLIVADGVSDTSQFGFRTTLQADSCAPEIQFAPPVYTQANGPITLEVFNDANWDAERGFGESLVSGVEFEAWIWRLDESDALLEQVDYARGMQEGVISLANDALTVGRYAAIINPLTASTWAPTNGADSYVQKFTVSSFNEALPTLDFAFGKRATLNGSVSYKNDDAPASGKVVFLDEDGDLQRDEGERFALTNAGGKYSFAELQVGGDYLVVLEMPDGECVRLYEPASGSEGFTEVTITEAGASVDFRLLDLEYPVVSGVGLATSGSLQIDWIPDGPAQWEPIQSDTGYDKVVLALCGVELTPETQLGSVTLFGDGLESASGGTGGTDIASLTLKPVVSASGNIVMELPEALTAGHYTLVVSENVLLNGGLLDGEWGLHRFAPGELKFDRFVSGDGVAGGQFKFDFTIADPLSIPSSALSDIGSGDSTSPLVSPDTGLALSAGAGTATISGTVWVDSSRDPASNHRQSSSEPLFGGVSLALVDAETDTVVATTVSDVDGRFSFEGVAQGNYEVEMADGTGWQTTSLSATTVTEEWLVARYTPNYTAVGTNAIDRVDITGLATLQTQGLPNAQPDLFDLKVRDVAAIDDVRYVSYTAKDAGGSVQAGVWAVDPSRGNVKAIVEGDGSVAFVGLDALDDQTLLAVGLGGNVAHIGVTTGIVTQSQTVLKGFIDKPTDLLPVGDVAVVSIDQAFAVVRSVAAPTGPQYLIDFNPETAELNGDPMVISALQGTDFGSFIGLEWFDNELVAVDTFGYAYAINPSNAQLTQKTDDSLGTIGVGGLSAQLKTKVTTGVITVDEGDDVTVGLGVFNPMITIWEDGDDTIDGGCGDDADLLMGDDSNLLPGVQEGSTILIGGRDNIRGRGGDDSIDGGLKGDIIAGEGGDDTITGGQTGNNRITGGEGNDVLTGGTQNDHILGGDGNDEINGLAGRDALYGGDGSDTLSGGDDADLLVGGDGVDTVAGDGGDDTLIVAMTRLGGEFVPTTEGDAVGRYDGGQGTDQLVLSVPTMESDQTVTFSAVGSDGEIDWNATTGINYISIESAYLEGGSGGDSVDASEFGGPVFIHGHGGDDSLSGGNDDDTLVGGDGADTIHGLDGNDSINGQAGADSLDGGNQNDLILGGDDNDTLLGSDGDDTLDGEGGDDSVLGGANRDVLFASLGTDRLDGGSDDDQYVLFDEMGVASLVDSDGDDLLDAGTLSSNLVLTLQSGPDTLTLEALAGEPFGDDGTSVVITSGSAVPESILLGIGNDLVVAPSETLSVPIYLDGGDGTDWLDMRASSEAVIVNLSGAIATGFDGVKAFENIIGSSYADELYGDAAANLIVGAGGSDTVDGGDNFDTFQVGQGPGTTPVEGRLITLNGSSLIDQSIGSESGDSIKLSRIERIQGSVLADRFVIESDLTAGWQLAGDSAEQAALFAQSISDEGTLTADFVSIDVLDYADYAATGGVQINLSLETATGTGGISGFNRVIGSSDTDILVGNVEANYLAGGDGDDALFGGDGADYLVGGTGKNLLLGGGGTDTAEYQGTADDYDVTRTDDGFGYIVSGADQMDYLYSVERLVFSDDLTVAQAIEALADRPVLEPLTALALVGSPVQGNEISASYVLAEGVTREQLSFTWLADGEAIVGQTADRLTLTQLQVGKTIALSVDYINAEATELLDGLGQPIDVGVQPVATAQATGVVSNVNDRPTGYPLIVFEGEMLVDGVVLYADLAEIEDADGLGEFTIQWLADDEPIEGAQKDKLEVTRDLLGKVISVQVQYVDGFGQAETVTSKLTDPVASSTGEATANLSFEGKLQEGGEVKLVVKNLYDINDVKDLFVVWQISKNSVDWKPINPDQPVSVDEPLMIPDEQDYVGLYLRAVLNVVDGADELDQIISQPVRLANTNDQVFGTVQVEGILREGEVLTAVSELFDEDGLGALQYQWLADGEPIEGANAQRYTLGAMEVGQAISVEVSYVDRAGTPESIMSAPTAAISQILTGDESSETLLGTQPGEKLRGLGGNDTIRSAATSKASLLEGGAGDDHLIGGDRSDMAIFEGNRADYDLAYQSGLLTVIDRRDGSPEGTDMLENLNLIQFADRVEFVLMAADRTAMTGLEPDGLVDVDQSQVFAGTRLAETFVVSEGVSAMIMAGDGDTVVFEGSFEDYDFAALGSQLQLSKDGFVNTVNIGGEVQVRTDDGVATAQVLVNNGMPELLLGNQIVHDEFDVMSLSLT